MRISWDGDFDIHHGSSLTGQEIKEENKMSKKEISRAKADLIIKDLWEKFNIWLPHYTVVNETILEVLKRHFEIVEIDADEIGSETIGEDFAV